MTLEAAKRRVREFFIQHSIATMAPQGKRLDQLAELLQAIAAEARAEQRADDLEWVNAHARDCGCADKIARAIREQP